MSDPKIDLYDRNNHSFIVKIWLEESEDENPKWRGHATHVLSRRRVQIQEMEHLNSFIAGYIAQMKEECNQAK
jgi:hypothetical protein